MSNEKDTFSAMLRTMPRGATVSRAQDGSACVDEVSLPGRQGGIVAALLKAGNQLRVMDVADLIVSGIFKSLDVESDGSIILKSPSGRTPVENVAALARETLHRQYADAPEHLKGTALIVRTQPKGRIKAILEGREHYLVEGFYAELVKGGGYYRGFVDVRQKFEFVNGVAKPYEQRIFVPVHNDELHKTVAEARMTFGKALPWPYVQQAISRAQEWEAIAA